MSDDKRIATIVANQINDQKRIETDASTFAELKEDERTDGLFEGNVRVVVKETRNELSMEKAKLPVGNFTLIVVADKVKSGADDYDDMGFNQLRQEAIDRGLDSSVYNAPDASEDSLAEALREHDEQVRQQEAEESQETSDRFDEMREKIQEAVSKCETEVSEILEEYADISPTEIIPDFSEFIEEVKDELDLR